MYDFEVIVALTPSGGIGRQGSIPWRLKRDMQHFRNVTVTTDSPDKINYCIMGRKTYLSIPAKFRPLDKRVNIVLSRDPDLAAKEGFPSSVRVCPSLDRALELIADDQVSKGNVGRVFVIGGQQPYEHAMNHSRCKIAHITAIQTEFPDCDTFFPIAALDNFCLVDESELHEEGGINFKMQTFKRK